MEVIWSPDSMEDLDFLFEYIAEDSVENAMEFIMQVRERANALADVPRQGRKIPELDNDYNYRPKINGKSIKLAESNQLRQKQPNIFLRLSEEDKLLKGKKQILEDMYTPSFKPMSYVPPNMNLDYLKKRNYISDNQILEEDEEKDNRKNR